jgi:hypothetical protein
LYRADDGMLRDVLRFRLLSAHRVVATRGQIVDAIAVTRGELVCARQPTAGPRRPLVLLIVRAMEIKEEFVGSSSEMLELLRKAAYTMNIEPPKSPDSLGKALKGVVAELRTYGIELLKLSRTPQRRLWSCCKLTGPNDTSDTSDADRETDASSACRPTSSGPDTCDAYDTSSPFHSTLMAAYQSSREESTRCR